MSDDLLNLRAAQPGDTALILKFIRDLARYEKLEHEVVADETTLHTHLFGDTPRAEVVIAEYDDQPAGFALFFHNFSTFMGQPGIYLEDLYVSSRLRGKGVGRALLGHLAELALQRGCGRLEWAVLDWNEPAIGFYRRLGAESKEDWSVFRLSGDALRRLGGD